MAVRLLLLPLMLLVSAPAMAGKRGPVVALMVSPAQLALPQVELTGDVKLSERSSVAGIVAFNLQEVVSFHHAGGQYRYTFTGDWSRGTFLGGELVTGDGSWTHADKRGLSAGAFVGGRYTFAPALTLEGSVGGRGWWHDQRLYPGVIVNLGIGWSF